MGCSGCFSGFGVVCVVLGLVVLGGWLGGVVSLYASGGSGG